MPGRLRGVQIVRDAVPVALLARMADATFGNLVKAVVDVDRGVMAIDAEMHSDEEALLLTDGSAQSNLWGVNFYPDLFGTSGFIEFDSMINIRPRQGNRTRSVDDEQRPRAHIESIVNRLVRAMTMHPGLASGRWRTMTLAEQLGNVGSDVGRAIRARATHDDARFAAALDRALDLMDLTIADPRWSGHRTRELARAREVLCDFLVGDNAYGSTAESLDAWFLAYAMAARRDR